MAAWRCTVCGYVHQGDKPPQSCPVCKVPASKFVKMDEPKSDKNESGQGGFMNKIKDFFK